MNKLKVPISPFKRTLSLFCCLLLLSCDGWDDPIPSFDEETANGYRPIYASTSSGVNFLTPQGVEKPGKIYVINEFLLLVDRLKGIHVFDNSDAESPVNLGFIQIAGNNDLAIRDNILYADQGKNLLAIDVSDLQQIKLAATVENVFPHAGQFPPFTGTYYECPDPSKGVVIDWEEATLQNPKCYR